MNIANINALADRIASLPWYCSVADDNAFGFLFDMRFWGQDINHNCGTAVCMAGVIAHDMLKLPLDFAIKPWDREAFYFAHGMAYLDIDEFTAGELFTAPDIDLYSINPLWAACVLRDLARTGEVDWKGNRPGATAL